MADSFPWVAAPQARVLVLGTVPGVRSLEAGEYYAHPRNVFWRVMVDLFGGVGDSDYGERIRLVTSSGVALWDVLASAERAGSLDSAINSATEIPNDIEGFLSGHPRVTHIFLNGTKAAALFGKYVLPTLEAGRIEVVTLPSTSPANAATSYSDKLAAWSAVADAARE